MVVSLAKSEKKNIRHREDLNGVFATATCVIFTITQFYQSTKPLKQTFFGENTPPPPPPKKKKKRKKKKTFL